ncbi:MAG: c-type cytochrome [Bacteroidota bacterium]|nr:c-type cytochrome [Bacteroidota bacterium]
MDSPTTAPPLSTPLRWYRRLVWLGILLNLGFCLPALLVPQTLTTWLGLPYLAYYDWLQNAGMLILSLNVFYAVAARNPAAHPAINWVVVLSRVIAAVFWVYLISGSSHPQAFYSMLGIDAGMALALGLLLQSGLPAGSRLNAANLRGLLLAPWYWVQGVYQRKPWRYATLAALLLLGIVGFVLYDNLLRKHPDTSFAAAEEQFKYGTIGLGGGARIPLYIFEVLPRLFADKLPQNGQPGYRSLGFSFEPGHALPVGLAVRHIGYKAVEPNCALCHTGTIKKLPTDAPQLLMGSPAHELDLERFQWFLYDCAADKRFNPDTLMAYIDRLEKLSPTEHLVYKHVIIPFAKNALMKQGRAYAWQKTRPEHGRGRTDTFNPTKDNVFHFPDDATIGTVDLPQVWNQRPREGLYLHWDGNNNSLHERNYAAAMAVGATPASVIPANFKRVTDYLLDLKPPQYPFPVDAGLAAKGQLLYASQCARCHQFGAAQTGQITLLEDVDTDPHRLDSFTTQLVERFHEYRKEPFMFNAYRKTYGYSNTPLDGIWARAPYLHNGSVPSLWDLLQAPAKRPVEFYRGYNEYDPQHVGFVSTGPAAEQVGFRLDTRLAGNANRGHRYGTTLAPEQKQALLEYLKTL